jgi:phosphoglycolate phosphatase-like HAD superfamily hydrolase
MRRLVLFDIDGTLLDCGGQSKPLFAAALEEVFGTTGDLERYDFSGRTDPRIVIDLLTGAGIPEAEVVRRLPDVRDRYLGRLDEILSPHEMRLHPGVLDLLESLVPRAEVTLALLTGNWRRGAEIKLSRFDLNRFFAFGAFGCDGIEREELPPVAWERAEQAVGRRFAPEETLIVGDSVRDVACGRAHGIPVLAVATGRTPAAALDAAGADWVIGDLTTAGAAVPWLSLPCRSARSL